MTDEELVKAFLAKGGAVTRVESGTRTIEERAMRRVCGPEPTSEVERDMTNHHVFTDYPLDDLPSIPEAWTDISYGDDCCPSWSVRDGVSVFVDYADPSMRELKLGKRFFVVDEDNSASLLETDDWDEVLAFVA